MNKPQRASKLKSGLAGSTATQKAPAATKKATVANQKAPAATKKATAATNKVADKAPKKKVAQNTDKNTCLSEHAKLPWPCQTCLTNFHVFALFPREFQYNKLAIFVDSFVILWPIDISGCCCCCFINLS